MGAIASLFPIAVLALLVFAQGGFFDLAPCLCGVVLCLISAVTWLRRDRRKQTVPVSALLFCAIAAAYGISAAANGLTLTTLAKSGTWAACAGMALLASSLDEATQQRNLKLLCCFSAATAVLGMLVYTGTITLVEGMVRDRLQLTFQYANAAGAWFAVGTLLCALAPDARLNRLTALPATALLLTQSGGSLIVFSLVATIAGVMWARRQEWDRLGITLVAGALATLCFALLHVAKLPITAVVLAMLLVAYALRGEPLLARVKEVGWKRVSLALVATIIAAAAVGLFVFRTRVGQATASMAERSYHVHDGLTLWLTNPLLGVGPNNWQYLYRFFQTAQYDTTVVHSSYVQLLLDAGVLGLALLAAAAALGMRALVDRARKHDDAASTAWATARIAAATFLLLHAALEFNLQFASLACLLTLLIATSPQAEAASTPAPSRHAKSAHATGPVRVATVPGLAAGIICLLVCLPLCLLGTLCETTAFAQRTALATGDFDACERLCTSGPFALNDVSSQERLLAAQYARQDYSAAVASFHSMTVPSDASALQAANACYQVNDRRQAGLILIERMEQQPYNVGLFDSSAALVNTWGMEDEQQARYRSAVIHANELAERVNPALPQKKVPIGI